MPKQFDKSVIKEAIQGREVEILSHVGKIPVGLLDGKPHPCPNPDCPDGPGKDRFRYDTQKKFCICNQCFKKDNGDIEAAIGWALGIDEYDEILKRIGDYLHLTPQPAKPQIPAEIPTQKKSLWKSDEVPNQDAIAQWCRLYKQGTGPGGVLRCQGITGLYDGKPSLGLPMFGADFVTITGRAVYHLDGTEIDGKKVKNIAGSKSGIIGTVEVLRRLSEVRTVYKVEGPTDAIALANAIPEIERQSVAVFANGCGAGESPGKTPYKELIEAIASAGCDLVLVGDNDKPGQDCVTKWGTYASQSGCKTWTVNLPETIFDTEIKDVRDYFLAGSRFADLDALAKPFLADDTRATPIPSDSDYFPRFLEDVSNPPPLVPTGFLGWDRFLKGGLRPGLYGFGAVSSLGKTSFMIQVADFIAESDRDVLIFSLEMTRNELIAKSLSRLTALFHEKSDYDTGDFRFAKTATDILDNRQRYTQDQDSRNQEAEKYLAASKLFQESIGPHRYIIEPAGRCDYSTIESTIKAFVTPRRSLPPVIIIDYLQVVAPGDKKEVRQHIDETVLSLKILSKTLQTPIFIVSSFNRFAYNKPVSYESFKESGGIEYTADFLCGLNPVCLDGNKIIRPGKVGYDYNTAKSQNPRIVELVILKNRYGETSPERGGFFEYFPAHNLFREIDGDVFEVEMDESTPTRPARKSAKNKTNPNQVTDGRAAASGEKDNEETNDAF